jgi:hypothetical protein
MLIAFKWRQLWRVDLIRIDLNDAFGWMADDDDLQREAASFVMQIERKFENLYWKLPSNPPIKITSLLHH